MIIFIVLFYFALGAVFACINCAIHSTPMFPKMSEEDKNTFVLIVTFWAILLPFKFIRRLYIAIKALLIKK